MTAVLALVRTPAEAAAALEHGADQAAAVAPRCPPGLIDPRAGWMVSLAAASDAAADDMVGSAANGPLWLPVNTDWAPLIGAAVAKGRHVIGWVDADATMFDVRLAEARGVGLACVLVATPPFTGRRLLDAVSVADLSRIADLCRGTSLRFGFAGALELPDLPRLRALGPDVIGFDTTLRDGADRFTPSRLAEIRAAMDANPYPGTTRTSVHDRPDRIVVRDWTVPMSVGAYARERGHVQRVRFTVDAQVAPRAAGAGMAGIVSYDLITDAIARLAGTHIDLVEQLADRLAAMVLAEPRILGLDITVEKLDVGPGSVGCRIFRDRTPV